MALQGSQLPRRHAVHKAAALEGAAMTITSSGRTSGWKKSNEIKRKDRKEPHGLTRDFGQDVSPRSDGNPGNGAFSFTDLLATMKAFPETRSIAKSSDDGASDGQGAKPSCPLPPGAQWCTAKSGDKHWQMAVYSAADPISNVICKTAAWEFADPKSMGLEKLPANAQLVDIGANVGWYSFMFAQHGFNVLAVEAMTANRALMNATLCKNPELKSKITVVKAALAEKATPGATCTIFSANINVGGGILACNKERLAALKGPVYNNANIRHIAREQVPLMTLNQAIKASGIQRVDLVKMDVERYECNVLEGGTDLLTRFHPKHLMIEARNARGGGTVDCTVRSVMTGGNYKIHQDSFAGPLTGASKQAGLFNLFFALPDKSGV